MLDQKRYKVEARLVFLEVAFSVVGSGSETLSSTLHLEPPAFVSWSNTASGGPERLV